MGSEPQTQEEGATNENSPQAEVSHENSPETVASAFVTPPQVVEPTEGTQQSGQPSQSHPVLPVNVRTHAPYHLTFQVADCQQAASNFCHWQGSYCPTCNTYTTNDGDTLTGIAADIWGYGGEQWRDLAALNTVSIPDGDGLEDTPLISGTKVLLP